MMNFGIVVPALSIFLLSCTSGKLGKNIGNKTVFRYNESAGLTNLDPAFSRNIENVRVVNLLFKGLVQLDSNLEIKPCIAMEWDISEDGLVYTFFLRRDVYFHPHEVFPGGRGRKVTAQDFVYSFLRIRDSKTASPGAWIFSNVDSDNPDHLGFEAPEKYTLRIYLKEAFQPFLSMLTMKYCSAVPFEVIDEYKEEFRIHPIGTGPFIFKMWKPGNKLILVKNDRYFERDATGNPLPYLDAVSISFIGDEEVEYLEFLKGNLDFISGTNSSNLEFLDHRGVLKKKYAGKFRMSKSAYLNTEYLGILMDSTLAVMDSSPLNDKLIRKALNFGFNRRDMIKFLRNNVGEPAEEGIIPRGLPPYRDDWIQGYRYNPDSARQLLRLAGYPGGLGLNPIKLSTTSQYLTLCEYIQGQLGELGIVLEIEMQQTATSREQIALSKIAFFRKSWVADYPDAENYLSLFYSGNFSPSGPNYTHFSNAEYDRLYEAARTEIDPQRRYELYRKMEEIILEESVIIPLYYDEVRNYVSSAVTGLPSNAMNLIDLRMVQAGPPK